MRNKELAENVWEKNIIAKTAFNTFDEYWEEVKKETAKWNLMTEDEQKYLQQQVLARLDRIIAEEEYENGKRKD